MLYSYKEKYKSDAQWYSLIYSRFNLNVKGTRQLKRLKHIMNLNYFNKYLILVQLVMKQIRGKYIVYTVPFIKNYLNIYDEIYCI
jgi:hypothetical protein